MKSKDQGKGYNEFIENSVSNNVKMKIKSRHFDTYKSNLKIFVLEMWKEGVPIQTIAKESSLSRPTIYRWVSEAELSFSKSKKRNRIVVDKVTKFKIIETYILSGAASMQKLSQELKRLFAIHLSSSQLRRYLHQWNVFEYRPSIVFKSYLQEQANLRSSKDN